jgi:hypothetical protein
MAARQGRSAEDSGSGHTRLVGARAVAVRFRPISPSQPLGPFWANTGQLGVHAGHPLDAADFLNADTAPRYSLTGEGGRFMGFQAR